MFCINCGHQLPEGARFCAHCGAPVNSRAGAAEGPSGGAPVSPRGGVPGSLGPPPPHPTGPSGRNRTALWIGIGVAVLIVVAVAVALPLVLLRGEEESVTDTTRIVSTTTTTASPTTTRSTLVSSTSPTTSTSTSTTTTLAPAGPAGDSPGSWVETQFPGFTDPVSEAAVSDEAVLVHTQFGEKPELHAYLFDSGAILKLPVQGSDIWSVDLEGLLAVWYEGKFSSATGEPYDMHVYAFPLPNGPKVEIAGGGDRHPYFPQVAGSWIAWTEGRPWDESPDEYWTQEIWGVEIDSQGHPVDDPVVLVSSALASVLGDAVWGYSLSPSHLAWENAASHDGTEAGTYVMDLAAGGIQTLGTEAWRPSLAKGVVVYWKNGVRYAHLDDLKPVLLDPNGDFPTAAPTYAAYYRFTNSADHPYEIVARGYSGSHEQVLTYASLTPWFSAPISASASRIAVVADEKLRLFEWQSEAAR